MSGIKFTQPQVQRLARLLHMEYTLRELADEIECSVSQLRRALDTGCPQRVTERAVWIVGDEFAAWYTAQAAARKKPLHRDEAFCLACRCAVPLDPTTIAPVRPGVERVSGQCPRCGSTINRFRSTL